MNNQNFNFRKLSEFDNHKLVSYVHDAKSGLQGFIALHRGNEEHPSFGATRLWKYLSEAEALQDALRLSKTMTYKAALAGLKYGGGKGVIIYSPYKKTRALLKSYTEKINYLNGHFITGADVGLNERDVKIMRRYSPFIVGLSSFPEKYTASGLFLAIQVCLKEMFGTEKIEGRTFAIQGVGNIGREILRLLYRQNAKIFIADIDKKKIKIIKKLFPKIQVIKPSEIHKQKVDIYSPCALSSAINFKNISQLRCKIIAGGANNQLENSRVGELLHRLNILYAPDYLINAGGLISVADEYEHKNHNPKRVSQRLLHIKKTLEKIIKISKRKHSPTNLIANQLAERIINKNFGKM